LLFERLVRTPPAIKERYRIEVRDGSRTRWLDPADVDWAQAAGNYVEIFGAFGTILHRRTLAALAEELKPHGFARIHRSRIVRKAAITATETRSSGDFDVILASGATIGGSRRYRDELA
jgi:DNA-binding LytR/AlgR family response regulator